MAVVDLLPQSYVRNNHDTSHDAASTPRKQDTFDVWRGMRNVCVCAGDDLRQTGGTELACMSTTANVAVALSYNAYALDS